MPGTEPTSARRTLSVRSWRTSRLRPAPRLIRSAISRHAVPLRAREQQVGDVRAQAIARINPTSVMSTKSGFEYFAAQRVGSRRRPRPRSTRGDSRPPALVASGGDPRLELWSEYRLRPFGRDAGPQPRHHLHPVEIFIEIVARRNSRSCRSHWKACVHGEKRDRAPSPDPRRKTPRA